MTRSRSSALARCAGRGEDRGAALITVLLLLMALTAVTTTVATVAINDTISGSQDRQSGAAFATADAGIAYGLEYIRTNSVASLTCDENRAPATPDSCAGNPSISNPVTPAKVNVSGSGACTAGGTCYDVWITTIRSYAPPAVKTGLYRVHAIGRSGGSPGAKALTADVSVKPASYPIGVYSTRLVGNGNTGIYNEMLFTQDCVSPRYDGSGNGLRFDGIDPYWGEPASANSTTQVSTANNCGSSGYVHRTSDCPSEPSLYFDRTEDGGPLPVGSPCTFTYTKPDGTTGRRESSKFSLEILEQDYGFQPGGLSESQYKSLKSRAQSLNMYNAPVGSLLTRLQAAVAAGVAQPVIYYDNVSSVSLSRTDIPAPTFARAPGETCTPYSVVIVVRNGNMVYQGGTSEWRDLAIFVPEGNFNGNGGYNILGTLFTQELNITGGQRFELDECFIRNLPGPVLDLEVVAFREDDRQDIG
jgi:Tfp pilus assembly protein PilX